MSEILRLLAANALVVYVGQAKILSSRYQHRLNCLKVMTRATLVELIYEKTLSMPAAAYNDYSAITLMSTDVDALTNVSEMFHEAWAQVLEVIVGMGLLAEQIGWLCLVPLPLIYARNLRSKQLAWNKATQDRINRVVSVVGEIKTIKMLGLGNVVRDQIGCLRQTEIDASKDMRWIAVLASASVVIGLAVFYSTENSSADVGIALNMVLITNTTLLRLIESWTTLEVSVGAAARLKELEDRVPNEEHLAIETTVPRNWPSAGSLALRDVRVCHGNRVILSNVELDVQPGAKVFICGETGSGKSTLLMALLRLCPVQHGSIQVDGVEIAQAAPSIIRERCFIVVPQDAFFQPDISLRSNIDPMDHHWTEEIMQALQQLHLWSRFQDASTSCHDQDNEDSRVLALPLSCFPPLSAGQTQLLSLARSVLRARYQVRQGRKPIILLDEPTANLDDEYESLSSTL
ncbi:P-loop containing nucleoside triphosphate hydrolase protein, partial [Aureobasidium melanogenum]